MKTSKEWFEQYTRRSQHYGRVASLCVLVYFVWNEATLSFMRSDQQLPKTVLTCLMLAAILSAIACLGSAIFAWIAKHREVV
jgi:hypothetical protein